MLSLAIGCALAIRVTVPTMVLDSVAAGVVALGLTISTYVSIDRRYRAFNTALRKDATLRGVTASPLVAAAATTVVLGAVAALSVFGAF